MYTEDPIVFTIFLVFSGAALLATLALFVRQSLLVAYILLGVLLGPSVGNVVNDSVLVGEISHIGIMFLLFLMGLELNPKDLLGLFRRTTLVTLLSSLLFALVGFSLATLFGFTFIESLIIGAATTFSSTIVGLKLLPTTVLHHRHTGEVIISVLLLQDLLAILLLVILQGGGEANHPLWEILSLVIQVPLLIGLSVLAVKYLLLPLITKYDCIHEYIFLLAIGWCLGLAEAAAAVGLSHEIGAFIAGITLATSPISYFMSEKLKPLRDFFLVIFFFSVGVGFDLGSAGDIVLPALLLAGLMLGLKPFTFRYLLHKVGDSKRRSMEIGVRLGQMSEFSLLVATLALSRGEIGAKAAYLIQMATLITFIVSSYLVVMNYPTPIALSDKLRRD
ncbi:MAG: cation:proton antiporter [Candidatus Sedimenticola sp. 20ELBAFRAG]